MQILSQRDNRWGNLFLGNSNTYIKDYGCTITSLAMIIGTTPDVINARLKAVQGFANGNLVIWGKIPEAFPGISINRVWSYNNDDVKNNVPNVLVEVPPNAIGGVSGKHWVVFVGDGMCNDPWTGSKRPTNDFLKYGDATGYCTVKGKWEGLEIPGEPTPSDDWKKSQFDNILIEAHKRSITPDNISENWTDNKLTIRLFDHIDTQDKRIEQLNIELASCENAPSSPISKPPEPILVLAPIEGILQRLSEFLKRLEF